jgi:hypothetical protein
MRLRAAERGRPDVIARQTATARMLPRYLKDRTDGPLFVTVRKARVELPSGDLDDRVRARLTYGHTEALFKKATVAAPCISCGTPRSPTQQRTVCRR